MTTNDDLRDLLRQILERLDDIETQLLDLNHDRSLIRGGVNPNPPTDPVDGVPADRLDWSAWP
jgi:hypothetical protein